MNKLIFAFPLALIGAIFFAAQPIMAFGPITVGLLVSAALGLVVYLMSNSNHKKAVHHNCKTSAFRASCLSLCGLALVSAGMMGNVYLAAIDGGIVAFLLFLLMTGITMLFGAAGFFGYRSPPSE